jgi:hypothetical protein
MIAFVLIVFAIACLAIGWLVTGKTRLEKMCGKDPTKKRGAACDDSLSCNLCSSGDNPQINRGESPLNEEEDEDHLAEEKKDVSSKPS